MQWKSRCPAHYPDQLIQDEWVLWSENVLNQAHSKMYSTPQGFQEFIHALSHTSNSENSDPRTRAVELFRVGLLRGLLVNEQGASKGSIPYGWKLVQDDHHVHTRLGYLAYILGKVIDQRVTSPIINKAFNTLCVIFVLQFGFELENRYILLATLFNYLLENFVPSVLVDQQKWQRYLAAAMFCTVETPEVNALVDAYVAGFPVRFLMLRFRNGSTERIDPNGLVRKVEENMSLGRLTNQKASLWWLGGEGRQGFYAGASLEGAKFVRLVRDLEQDALAQGIENPFKMLLKPNKEEVCVLEQFDSILELSPNAGNEWKRLMRTLREGVTEALHFLERVEVSSKRVFFVHDLNTAVFNGETLTLEVAREKDEVLPRRNEIIIMMGQKYVVQEIEEGDDYLAVVVSRLPAGPQSQQEAHEAVTQS